VSYGFPYDKNMEAVTVSEARERLYRLVGDVSAAGEPVLITGSAGMQFCCPRMIGAPLRRTLYLLSVPGMRESIREGMGDAGGGLRARARVVKWRVVSRRRLSGTPRRPRVAGLRERVEELLTLLREEPLRTPPRFERLAGDLKGAYSRRINIQHRLVYQVLEEERVVKGAADVDTLRVSARDRVARRTLASIESVVGRGDGEPGTGRSPGRRSG